MGSRAPRKRIRRVTELLNRRLSVDEIADRLNSTPSAVKRLIEQIEDEWLAEVSSSPDRLHARELARIDHLEAVAWSAWEESVRDMQTHKVVITDNDKRRVEQLTKTPNGDPAYLTRISWCMEQRIKLLRLTDVDPTEKAHAQARDVARKLTQFGQEAADILELVSRTENPEPAAEPRPVCAAPATPPGDLGTQVPAALPAKAAVALA